MLLIASNKDSASHKTPTYYNIFFWSDEADLLDDWRFYMLCRNFMELPMWLLYSLFICFEFILFVLTFI